MKRKYKIINKRRFYMFLIVSLAILIMVILSFFPREKVHSLSYDVKYHQVEVRKGDTLWNIALEYLPEGSDVRKLVYEINQLNGDKTSYIYPGDIIKVPKY